MNRGNEIKNKALGQPYGTATSKLRKMLMFDMAKRLNEDICYRCDVRIERLEDFSIEHKKSWLYSENPIEVFFDLSNISFSHIICNVRAARPTKGYRSTRSDNLRILGSHVSWCSVCKKEKSVEEFGKNSSKNNLRATECLECRKLRSK